MDKNITHFKEYIDSSPLDTLNFNDTDIFVNTEKSHNINQIETSPLDTLNFNDNETENNIFVNTEEGFFDNPRSKNDKLKVNKKKFNNPTSYSNTSIQSTEELLNRIYGGSDNFENSHFSEHSSDINISEYSGNDNNDDQELSSSDENKNEELSSSDESYSELSGGDEGDEGEDDEDDEGDEGDDE